MRDPKEHGKLRQNYIVHIGPIGYRTILVPVSQPQKLLIAFRATPRTRRSVSFRSITVVASSTPAQPITTRQVNIIDLVGVGYRLLYVYKDRTCTLSKINILWGWLHSNAYPRGPCDLHQYCYQEDGKPWCSVQVDAEGNHLGGRWGLCNMTACSRPFDESGRHCTAVSESTPGQNGTRVRVSDILSPSFPYHPVQLAEYKKKQKSFLEPCACRSYFLVKVIISGKRKRTHWPPFIYIHKFSIETPCINHKTTVSSWIRFRRQLIRKTRMAMTTMAWQVAQMSRKPSR